MNISFFSYPNYGNFTINDISANYGNYIFDMFDFLTLIGYGAVLLW